VSISLHNLKSLGSHRWDFFTLDSSTKLLENFTAKHYLKMNSTTNELSTPLLSNLRQHERDADAYDEEGSMPCSLKLVVAAADDDEESNDDSTQYDWWFDICVLPALLFLQFGMAFSMCPVGADNGLGWSLVNYSIVMFGIIGTIYRQAVKDSNLNCSVVPLVPEILVVIVMCLVVFGKVLFAFLVLQCGMLCLALFVVASNIQVLVVAKASPKQDYEGCMPYSLKLVVADDDDDAESNDDSSTQYDWWFDICVLPALLFVQFCMAFSMRRNGADKGLCWSFFCYSIVMIVITAALYRRALKDSNLTCSVVFLVPEFLVMIAMGLVLFGKVLSSFLILLSSMLCLAVFIRQAITRRTCTHQSLNGQQDVFIGVVPGTRSDCVN
jgi:hypothetical protein